MAGALIRWSKDRAGEKAHIWREESRVVVLENGDPRLADLIAVLGWLPPHQDWQIGGDFVRWWNDVPLETIEHLVKKT